MPQQVPILIGSKNDRSKIEGAVTVLKNFGLEPIVLAGYSAHRTPELVAEFCRTAKRKGYRGILTAAGMANHLSGTVAAKSRLPVFGIPLSGGPMEGLSALYATVDMPPGVPVATFGIDAAANAALHLIRQLAIDDPALDRKLRGFIERGSNVKAPMPNHSGKVTDTFLLEGVRLGVVSDRLSAFDWVLDDPIPNKGRVLSQLTRHWLTETPLAWVCENHLLNYSVEDLPDWAQPLSDRVLATAPYHMLQLECIVRGYLVGSAWSEYQKHGTMHGEALPEGMVQAQRLPQATFTPSTKAEEGAHDENINQSQAADIVGADMVEKARALSLALFEAGTAYAAERGIIILDTKFEFGINQDDNLVLCDEVFTPDSSRFVDAATFEEGREPLSMDKQYARDWILSTGWDKEGTEPPPPLPLHVIAETGRRYEEIYGRLTGKSLLVAA